ncbi:MAG: DUF4255 domain-containing protein, partial [Microcystaceae cyanobacterium]
MLTDLDQTIEILLRQELSSEEVQALNFSFEPPVKESIGKLPAINLFLYDVRENLELRSSVGTWQRQSDSTAIKKRPPVRVDCSYLITAWPGETLTSSQEEHRLLGRVMKVLLRYPQ